jgi:hypothetical protein
LKWKTFSYNKGIEEFINIKSDDEIAVVANLLVNESVFTIQIIREDWYTHLNTSLTYFEGLEDYETCQNIKELLDCL